MTDNSQKTPCESFDIWATNPDTRIASAGLKLRIKWCEAALNIPVLVPVTSFIMQAVRAKWPEPGAANSTLASLADVAEYITTLEDRVKMFEGVGEVSHTNIMRETALQMTAMTDAQTGQRLIEHLHRGGTKAYYWTLPDKRTYWHDVGKNGRVPDAPNVYMGVNPTNAARDITERARNEDVSAANCLFAEFDAKDRQFLNAAEQHEHDRIEAEHKAAMQAHKNTYRAWVQAGRVGDAPKAPSKEDVIFDLDTAKARALAHIRTLPLAPSVIVDSGGGFHCYWLLDQTFIITTETDRRHLADLQARWVQAVGGDQGAKDLARVLRVPGTLNSKPAYNPPKLVTCIEATFTLYTLAELEALTPVAPTRPTAAIVPKKTTAVPTMAGQLSAPQIAMVAGEFNKKHDVADILAENGYDVAPTARNGRISVARPGKNLSRDGESGNIENGVYVNHSSNDPYLRVIEKGEHGYKAFAAWAAFDHGNNEQIAARLAAAEMGIELGRKAESPTMAPIEPGDETALDEVEPAKAVTEGRKLPDIQVNARELRDVSADAIKALAATGEIFIRSGELVRVCVDEKDRAGIEPVGESAMRGMLARCASFFTVSVRMVGKKDEKKEEAIYTIVPPPLDIVRDVLSLKVWPFKPLEGVIESPTMRPDGSILSKPGYDKDTRLFYQPAEGFVLPGLPEHPDRQDVAAALTLLHEVICDFPFEDDASRDNALAAMLTPIARPMISGPVPLAIADAPQQGTGKTLLAQVMGQLATGEIPEPSPAPDAAEEWRKTVTAQLSAGRAVIVLDNVTKTLEDGSLAAVLTSTTWSDRLMGRNDKLIRLPARACWIVTGNNVSVGGDLVSRCYLIRLDAKTSRPQERDGFKHPQIETWVRNNRGVLLGAALTLCRAWHLAERPAPTCPKSRYAEWRNIIGGILEYAGAKSFLGNLRQFQDTADSEGPAWESFICKLSETFPGQAVTSAMIYSRFANVDGLADYLPDELAGLLGAGDDQKAKNKFSQSLGYAFRARLGKRFGDTQARVMADRKAQGSQYWRFMTSKEA